MILPSHRIHRMLPLCIVLAATVACSGCAQKMSDGQRTRAEGTGAGAAGGAVIGHVLAGPRGAVIGATVGAAIGYAVGDNVAKDKEQRAQSEDALNKVIAEAKASTSEFQQINADLSKQIVALEDRRTKLKTTKMTQRARQSAMREQNKQAVALLARTEEETKRLDSLVAQHRRAVDEARRSQQTASSSRSLVPVAYRQVDGLAAEREALEKAKQQLELIDPRRIY